MKYLYYLFFPLSFILAQTHIPADPVYLLQIEKYQFKNKIFFDSGIFRPIFFKTDSLKLSITFKTELYLNNNAPNQENMDVRYFSKGYGDFKSIKLSMNSPFFSLIAEPYILEKNYYSTSNVIRDGPFKVLNDRSLNNINNSNFRNFLAFVHFKGIGFGWHEGNRWWGPGLHTTLQMTNNTKPLPAQIIGTINEIRIGDFGIYGLYSFSNLNKDSGELPKYFTSINGKITWYGPMHISAGFSRNYLSGGEKIDNYIWTEDDARKLIFEGIFTSNLLDLEYTSGGHDLWDQTLSGYLVVTHPEKGIKLYGEIGFNDNRMYFADFLSQPDHSMATIFGIRNYGVGKRKNILWGFEWTNLMITYSSRHRPTGTGEWYERSLYEYSTYAGRRWGAHSGTDSDDWYIYAGYLSDKFMVVPALNYERHGIVSHRPAEVKLEATLDLRYKYRDIWFGIFYEKQFEAFLGFPDYFYVDKLNQPTDYYSESKDGLANDRSTNTLIFSISKTIEY